MSAITTITGLLSNASTPFTLTGVQGSSGANLPAVYRDLAASTVSAHQTEARLRIGENSARTKLTPRFELSFPIVVNDANGQPFVKDRANFTVTGAIPATATAAIRGDILCMLGEIIKSVDSIAMVQIGFAPN